MERASVALAQVPSHVRRPGGAHARARKPGDLDRCVALLRAVHDADRYPVRWPEDPARWIEGRRTIAAWVAEDRDEFVGHLALTAPDPESDWPQWREALGTPSDRLAVVRRFFVAPGRRERGVGGVLLDCAHAAAAAWGLRLVLDVADHNRAAIRFYEQRGWRRVGTAQRPPLRLVLFVEPPASR